MLRCDQHYLLVEDKDTQGVIRGLLGHYVAWGKYEDTWPVKIDVREGAEDVLDRKFLKEKLKEGRLVAIGLIVDADDDIGSRWASVRELLQNVGGTPPRQCPQDGLILDIRGKRVGVWIMPNNKLEGMVENFCSAMVPDEGKALWSLAAECTAEAKNRGAPFRHSEKANIYTWLAWQEPPGIRMGPALTRKVLHHGTPDAKLFVTWFTNLFGLQINETA